MKPITAPTAAAAAEVSRLEAAQEEDEAQISESELRGEVSRRQNFHPCLDQYFDEGVNSAVELSERFLCQALSCPPAQLAHLRKLELQLDTSQHNLQTTGELLPSLEVLKLSGSVVHSFRDLGTSLRQVRVLAVARCHLREL